MHPIFQRYTISELAKRLGYGEYYLLFIRDGHTPATNRFRRIASLTLDLPESQLFLEEATDDILSNDG
jgi:hypothetical protein